MEISESWLNHSLYGVYMFHLYIKGLFGGFFYVL